MSKLVCAGSPSFVSLTVCFNIIIIFIVEDCGTTLRRIILIIVDPDDSKNFILSHIDDSKPWQTSVKRCFSSSTSLLPYQLRR